MAEKMRQLPIQTTGQAVRVPTFADLPTDVEEGSVRYVDADDVLYLYNGVSWSNAAGETVLAGNGLVKTISTISAVDDPTGGANLARAINVSSNGLAVKIDDATIGEGAASRLEVKNGGITNAKIASGVDAAKVGAGTVSNTEFGYLDGVTSAIQTQLDNKQASGNYITDLTGDVAASGPGSAAATIQPQAVTSGKIATSVAGDGLAGGGGSPLSVNVDSSTIEINTDILRVKDAGITDAKIATGVNATKIAAGTVDNTEFGYLNGVTSAIQTQLDGKQAIGNYITALTGDVVATGPGSATATIQSQAVDAGKIAASVAGAGLAGGAGSPLSVNVDDSTIEINVDTVRVKDAGITNAKIATGVDAAKIGAGTVSNTEFGYLDGVTSAIQTQIDSKQSTSEKGQPNGYASLDGSGKVPVAQLPNAIMEYQGTWNASTNSPTLADGTGSAGDVYRVGTAGTQDLGSGNITFDVGDYAIYNGATWEKADTTDAVSSVNGQTGIVVLDTDDIAEGANLYFTDERAQDAVGGILTDSATIDFTYNDPSNTITAAVKTNSIDETYLTTSVAGSGLSGGNGAALSVNIDDSTIEINTDTLRVKDGGITNAKIAAGVDALKIGAGTVSNTEFGYLDGVTSAIQTQLDGKQATGNYITALTGDVVAAGPGSATATIQAQAVDSSKLATSVAGAGLSGGGGAALSVNVDDTTIEIVTDILRVKDGGITNAKIASGIDAVKLANGTVSNTEFQYLDGVTSAIQTQLDGKEPTITTLSVAKGGTNSGTALNNNRVMQSSSGAIVEAAAITASRALISDANGIPTHSSVMATELGYVSGVTSAIQTQFNNQRALNQNISVSSNVTLTDRAMHLVSTAAARSLTLPSPSATLWLAVKDVTGTAQTNNITLTPASGNIQGASSYLINWAYGGAFIFADGTNYFVI